MPASCSPTRLQFTIRAVDGGCAVLSLKAESWAFVLGEAQVDLVRRAPSQATDKTEKSPGSDGLGPKGDVKEPSLVFSHVHAKGMIDPWNEYH